MNQYVCQLVNLLSDHKPHSLEEILERLSINRSLWEDLLQLLDSLQVCLKQDINYDYFLPAEINLLEKNIIYQQLLPVAQSEFRNLEIFPILDSTHDFLLRKIAFHEIQRGEVCLAEYQTAGRGRRGKQWIAPFGSNLMLSLTWTMAKRADVSGLSLVVALAIREALSTYGIQDFINIKWPNDLMYQQHKMAGILIDTVPVREGLGAVISMGINVNCRADLNNVNITQPWISLYDITQQIISRNRLAAYLLNAIQKNLVLFAEKGLKAFLNEWQEYDSLWNKPVRLLLPHEEITGIAHGINEQGELRVKMACGEIKTFSYGEVSVRVR